MYRCNDGFCGAYDCPRCYTVTTCEECGGMDHECECVPCSKCSKVLPIDTRDDESGLCEGCSIEALEAAE
jgi:hypothetical protein